MIDLNGMPEGPEKAVLTQYLEEGDKLAAEQRQHYDMMRQRFGEAQAELLDGLKAKKPISNPQIAKIVKLLEANPVLIDSVEKHIDRTLLRIKEAVAGILDE